MAPLLLSQVVLVSNDQKVQLVSMSASKVKWGNRFTKPPHAPQMIGAFTPVYIQSYS